MNAFAESFRQAVAALLDHRLRTLLSILGITIGIAAVMAVSTVSKGGNYVVFSELQTFGLNSIWVYRDYNNDSPSKRVRNGTGLNNKDYEAIRSQANTLGVAHITPIVRPRERSLPLRNSSRYANATVRGVDADYVQIVNDTLASGRGFNSNDIRRKNPVAIIAPEIVEKLFTATTEPVGQNFRYAGQHFTVVGVIAPKSRDFLASIGSEGGQNANDRVLIPYTRMQKINARKDISTFQIEVAKFERAEETAIAISQLLERRHQGDFQYSYQTMAGYIVTTNRILGGVAIVGIVAASISLLVGGMGILNMMSTAVLERTREIGIRKAVGASEADIQWQFLLEAILISLIGGSLGLLLGIIASVVLARISGFPVIPSLITIFGALLVSVLVGILSGFLPARRAAKLHPVDALRSQ